MKFPESIYESERVPEYGLAKVQEILVHGLTNAADHKFVLPRQRGEKISSAIFEITYQSQGDLKTLELRDNGAGINHQAIHKIVKERNWTP